MKNFSNYAVTDDETTGKSSTSSASDSGKSKYPLIPKGTVAKVSMALLRGDYKNLELGNTGEYAHLSTRGTNAVYLKYECVVCAGKYHGQKLFGTIGLFSPNGPRYQKMGKSFIRSVLNSARAIHPNDLCPRAQALRCIKGFEELDGIKFIARIEIEKDDKGTERNVLTVVEPDDPDYDAAFGRALYSLSDPDGSDVSAEPARPVWGEAK
jgi:hypothetical protein